jgi:hypothetical protein
MIVRQVLAFQKLHREEDGAGGCLTEVMDLDDVLVTDAGGGAGFLNEALHQIGLRGKVLRQDLDGHPPLDHDVLGQVDRAHAARPELLDDPVAVVEQHPDIRVLHLGELLQYRRFARVERVTARRRVFRPCLGPLWRRSVVRFGWIRHCSIRLS